MLAPRVPDRVDPDRNGDRTGQRHEQPAQRGEVQLHADQRQQPPDPYRRHITEHGGEKADEITLTADGLAWPDLDISDPVTVRRTP